MSIPIVVNLRDGDAMERAILDVFARKVNSAFQRSVKGIRSRLAEEIDRVIKATPEYSSLLSGQLWHELGVENPEGATQLIIQTIQESIYVRVTPVVRSGTLIRGGMSLGVLRSNYSDVLGLPISSFESEHGYQIDWLRWLLLEGDSIINAEYHFETGYSERSRTGDGIMLRTGVWRVPAEFSGVSGDNWLTRALNGIEPVIKTIVITEIKRQF